MAKIITTNPEEQVLPTNPVEEQIIPEQEVNLIERTDNTPDPQDVNITNGNDAQLNTERFDDPDSISVTINDTESPIIILFGPPACGKTMSLIRLTRHLNKTGYIVDPVREFRHSSDTNYANLCDNFNNMVINEKSAPSTNNISFMLIKIGDQYGTTLCQVLEAPGELYYNPQNPDQDFPPYVHAILNNDNRKIWLFMAESQWKNQQERDGYVYRIKKLTSSPSFKSNKNKVVILFNKIDKTNFMPSGIFNTKAAHKYIKDNYPGLFEYFTKKVLFGSSKRYIFLPFSSGNFNGATFTQGSDDFPRGLWQVLNKLIKG